ncbi:hypothetical protein ACUTAF_22915 [Pseudomonas sp. SP16.1]
MNSQKEQRKLPALRAHIDQMLREGWEIIDRNPLKLRSGRTPAWSCTAC